MKRRYKKFKLIIDKEEDALLDISKLPEESLRNGILNQTNTVIDLLKIFRKKSMKVACEMIGQI